MEGVFVGVGHALLRKEEMCLCNSTRVPRAHLAPPPPECERARTVDSAVIYSLPRTPPYLVVVIHEELSRVSPCLDSPLATHPVLNTTRGDEFSLSPRKSRELGCVGTGTTILWRPVLRLPPLVVSAHRGV